MSTQTTMTPRNAWDTIDDSQWTEENIRHLCRRASWAARPAEVKKLAEMAPEEAIDYLFKRAQYPESHEIVAAYAENVDEALGDEIDEAIIWAKGQPRYKGHVEKIKTKTYRDPHAMVIVAAHYNHLRNEARRSGQPEKFRAQFRDRFDQREYWKKYALDWLKIANRPQNSAFEKAVTFWQNIWVVNWASLHGPSYNALADIHNHHKVLRDNFYANYPDLCKRAYKTRGMGYMLDIIGSTKNRPNENFARELMELFILGVDNGYDEDDIKEASKAFTGYKPKPDISPYAVEAGVEELYLDAADHDDSRKKVYGRSRDYDGDAIVDLIFSREESEIFIPSELCRFYLSDERLPAEYTAELGKQWRANEFNDYWLLKRLFTSRIFYSPRFRGRIFKSPHQFYLGLLQDLGLQVEPSLEIVQELDYLGQPFADPPDVNGWNGGAFWMNNGTINARRLMAKRVFSDTYSRGGKMATAGAGNYTVSDDLIRGFLDNSGKEGREAVGHFITYLLPVTPREAYVEALQAHYAKAGGRDDQVRALKEVIMAILQSQYYQVC